MSPALKYTHLPEKLNRNMHIVALSLAALFVAGCAGVGKQVEPPRISLANIQVQEVSGLETVFQIQLRIFNTNDVDLKVKGIETELEVNGRHFATGVSNTTVDIPSFDTQLVPVTVYSSVIDMFKSIYGLRESEQLTYRLRGKVRVTGNNMLSSTLPFESEGQVTLKGSEKLDK
jgi:LEA14-like dessication related protein